MTEVYWIGKLVVIEWALTGLDGSPVTDATVTGQITLPDGTTATAQVSQDGGTYRASYDPTMAGTHAWRLEATGTADGAEEGTFDVRPSPAASPAPVLDPSTPVGMVRLLIPDRDVDALLFTDAEITGFIAIEGGIVKRGAALALETVASNEVMVSKVIKTQDLQTDGAKASDALLKRAAELRRQVVEDDPDTSGGLDIIDFRDPFTRPWRGDHELTEPESWWC